MKRAWIAAGIASVLMAAGGISTGAQEQPAAGGDTPRQAAAPKLAGAEAKENASAAEAKLQPAGTQAKAAKADAKAKPKPKSAGVEAKVVFGAQATAAPMPARAIGFYARGCLAGAQPLAIDGPNWQAMRLSRNRNWGHPELIALVERLAADAKAHDGWPGLLVGDISQPRGGPMLTGHASHQIGLDADVWLTPMPDRRLSYQEREDLAATSMLGQDGILVDPGIWTEQHARLILRAASYPQVERVLVHPGIKKALCAHPGADAAALGKVRPYWGHHFHMHIRMACPADSTDCQPQKAHAGGDTGCGKEVDDWIALMKRSQKPVDPTAKAPTPKPGLRLDELPAACRLVLDAGSRAPVAANPAVKATADGR